MLKNFREKKKEKQYATLSQLTKELKKSKDFVEYFNPQTPQGYYLFYFNPIIDTNILHRDIIKNLNEAYLSSIREY